MRCAGPSPAGGRLTSTFSGRVQHCQRRAVRRRHADIDGDSRNPPAGRACGTRQFHDAVVDQVRALQRPAVRCVPEVDVAADMFLRVGAGAGDPAVAADLERLEGLAPRSATP